jgi:signal transduction histidine kinase
MAPGNPQIHAGSVVDEMSSELHGPLLTDDEQPGDPFSAPSGPPGPDARPARGQARNWQLRTRLTVVAGVPLLLALALGGLAVHEARGDATVRDATIVGAGMLVALIAVTVIARTIVAALRELRESALDIADCQLPTAVRLLHRTGGSVADLRIDTVPVYSDEDVGGIARAFDAVQREAVRSAAGQAALRAHLNDMFVALSRRDESLVERQLVVIGQLTRGEQDAQRLAALRRLDHLTKRVRRRGENLLVLAGAELQQVSGEPAPVTDVLHAAVSEIEDYQRIVLHPVPQVAVSGLVVSDVVHLVAELLDNATAYSNPEMPVTLGARLTRDAGLAIEITDAGTALPPVRLAEINNRLAALQEVDVSVLRQTGLFVVGRLANRHGFRVHLSSHDGPGITATVALPNHLVIGADRTSLDTGRSPQPEPASVAPPVPADAAWAREPASQPPSLDATTVRGPAASAPLDAAPDRESPAYTQTAPVPVVATPDALSLLGELAEAETNDLDTPIFRAMLSRWFTEADQSGRTAVVQGGWESEADAGWLAAQAVGQPVEYELTAAGLPKRRPQAFLVPGSVGASATTSPPGARNADAVRGRMASYQQGLTRGRHSRSTSTPDELPAGDGYGRHTKAVNTDHDRHIAEENR